MIFLKKLTPFTLPFLLAACGNDDLDPDAINAPDIYEFTSVTDPSAISSVDYKDATTRLVLIKELEHLLNSDYLQRYAEDNGKEAAVALLNRVYEGGTKLDFSDNLISVNLYDDSSTPTPIQSINFTNETATFSSLSENINLKEAMPGIRINLPLRKIVNGAYVGEFLGWSIININNGDAFPNTMIQQWFDKIATLATDTDNSGEFDTTTQFSESNINYRDLIITFLSASIPYSEITNIHLNTDGLTADNSQNDSSLPYTQLEHHWDMAFGYFGTRVTAKNESLENIAATANNSVNLVNEMVFDTAAATAQRDLDAVSGTSYLSRSIIKSALTGRQLISSNRTSQLDSYSKIISDSWEKTLAATLIHHINGTIDNGLTPNFDHWSHMKAYSLALQFNPNTSMPIDTMRNILNSFGTTPGSDQDYLINIFNIRSVIQKNYQFPIDDSKNW